MLHFSAPPKNSMPWRRSISRMLKIAAAKCNASPNDEACSTFSLMLRSRRFPDALVPASWIDEPNLKICAGLLHSRLVQFEVVVGNHRACGCEGGRHIGPHSNSQHHERRCRQCYRDTFVHEYPLASARQWELEGVSIGCQPRAPGSSSKSSAFDNKSAVIFLKRSAKCRSSQFSAKRAHTSA